MSLKELTRRVRRAMGLTQEQFAQKLGATGGSVQNWESGRKRPAPTFLRKMAGLAPDVALDIQVELEAYEWHRMRARSETLSELELPTDIAETVQRLVKKHELDTSVILLEALRTGLAALSRDSSADLKALVKRQADISRRVENREHPSVPESSRKRRRSKVA